MSPLQRIPAGAKFAFLFLAGIGLYLTRSVGVLAAALAVAVVAVSLTGTAVARLARPLLGLLVIVGLVVVTTGLQSSWPEAVVTALRLLALCLFGYALSLSTPFAAMLALFERALAPTRYVGLRPAQISLALSLTIRFVPDVRARYLEVREAQFARGLDTHPLAVFVPLIVRSLLAAEQIAEAIDARCYDSDDPGEPGDVDDPTCRDLASPSQD